MTPLCCAVDLDGMLLAFPHVLIPLLATLQKAGARVGVLTARPDHEQEDIGKAAAEVGFTPDFVVCKPDDLAPLPDGVFKAEVCTKLGIDVLYDDMESDNPTMIADFFAHNTHTVVFTSWAYQP
jgi:phosphoglycolate phosphatase-like HAD superfamily hydrolase